MFAKLIMVTAVNNNKFYIMQSNPDNTSFTATYGRVGTSGQCAVYPMSKWNQKYNEKIRKGYADVTALVETAKKANPADEFMEEAKVAFFYDEATLKRLSIDKKTAGIHPSDIHDVLCQTTTNQDVELYLTHPDEWFDKISAKVLKIEGDRLCQLFRRRLSLQQILQKVWKEPLHPWNQAMKLAHTVRDKATVVLTVEKDGKTECFRVKTNGLLEHSLGQYDDRCILPKDRQLLREKYDTKCYRFSIANIKKATYKNRVIFKA